MQSHRLIVVLGMHRSGTSAVARALMALGVGLGENLIEGVENNNEKGFFEDRDIAYFNQYELLPALGLDWHSLDPIGAQRFELPQVRSLTGRAAALLEAKTAKVSLFGLKDPRLSRLLPFWQRIFDLLALDVTYVLTLRNPLSVASSLARRDGFDPVTSCTLWLVYLLDAIEATRGSARIFVDYDRLMQSPQVELARIAAALGLAQSPETTSRIEEYAREFLSETLRHSRYSAEDATADPNAIEPVRVAARLVETLAVEGGEVSEKQWLELRRMFDRYTPLLGVVSAQSRRLSILDDALNAAKCRANDLRGELDASQREMVSLRHAIASRDWQISGLNATVSERDARILSIHQALAERDARLVSQQQALAERDARLVSQQQALAERDALIAAMLASTSWRLTRPLRTIGTLLRRNEPRNR